MKFLSAIAAIALVILLAASTASGQFDARNDADVRQLHGGLIRLGVDVAIENAASHGKEAKRMAANAAANSRKAFAALTNLPVMGEFQGAADEYARQTALAASANDTLGDPYLQWKANQSDPGIRKGRSQRYVRDLNANAFKGALAFDKVSALEARLDALESGHGGGSSAATDSVLAVYETRLAAAEGEIVDLKTGKASQADFNSLADLICQGLGNTKPRDNGVAQSTITAILNLRK